MLQEEKQMGKWVSDNETQKSIKPNIHDINLAQTLPPFCLMMWNCKNLKVLMKPKATKKKLLCSRLLFNFFLLYHFYNNKGDNDIFIYIYLYFIKSLLSFKDGRKRNFTVRLVYWLSLFCYSMFLLLLLISLLEE